MKKFLLLAILALTCWGVSAGDLWMTDFQAAQKVATTKKLPMLLLFTGSDWCPWCKYLDRDVLNKAEFKNYAKKHAIAVFLDFPRGKVLPPELKKQNRALANKYGIQGFPTMVVVNAQGQELGRLGYNKSAKKFVNKIKSFVK